MGEKIFVRGNGNWSLLAGSSESFKHSRRGETMSIFTGIYRKGYPTSFSSWAFLLKSLGLHLMDPGMDQRAAVFCLLSRFTSRVCVINQESHLKKREVIVGWSAR